MRLEAEVDRQLVDRAADLALEGRAGRHVGDLAAADTEEVVVMFGEVLGQLEARELVTRRDPAHHSGALQVNEVPVGRAAGELRQAVSDVTDADRVAGVGQELDKSAAPRGVPQVRSSQPGLDQLVDAHVLISHGGHHSTAVRKVWW